MMNTRSMLILIVLVLLALYVIQGSKEALEPTGNVSQTTEYPHTKEKPLSPRDFIGRPRPRPRVPNTS
ncbi:MAG: hypothetical protein V3T58_01150 [Candidatus Hydrothermarchaeales archaeon]